MVETRFVSTGPVPGIVGEILNRFGPIQVSGKDDEDTLVGLMDKTIGLIVRGTSRITKRIIDSGKSLQVIGRSGVGFDNVDVEAATARGIPVVITPGAGARAVAEGAMALIMALVKRLPELDRETKSGHWHVRDTTRIGDLEGAVLGIVGLGQIGRELARLASSFEMRLLAYDPWVPRHLAEELNVELVDLDSLLAVSDFVSLHAPLSDTTKGLINRHRLALMKHGAVLVNLARGGLFESLDLVYEFLQSGQLSAVGLDVYPQEPPDVSHPIFGHPHVLCTPHALGLSVGATRKIFTMMSRGMAAVLDGELPENVVNLEALRKSLRLGIS